MLFSSSSSSMEDEFDLTSAIQAQTQALISQVQYKAQTQALLNAHTDHTVAIASHIEI